MKMITYSMMVVMALVGASAQAQSMKSDPTKRIENCINGVDDNGNGKIDCFEDTCRNTGYCLSGKENCINGLDDDADGNADCLDSDCRGTWVCEVTPEKGEACRDNIDNDLDGITDCADTDCKNVYFCLPKYEVCDNMRDDDGDGGVDCGDTDCAGTAACKALSKDLSGPVGGTRGNTGISIGGGSNKGPAIGGAPAKAITFDIDIKELLAPVTSVKVVCDLTTDTRGAGASIGSANAHYPAVSGAVSRSNATISVPLNSGFEAAMAKGYRCSLSFCKDTTCKQPAANATDDLYKVDAARPLKLNITGAF